MKIRLAGGSDHLNNNYVWQGVGAFKRKLSLAGGSEHLNENYVCPRCHSVNFA